MARRYPLNIDENLNDGVFKGRQHREISSDAVSTEFIMSYEKLNSIVHMKPNKLLQLILQKTKGFLKLLQTRDLSDEVLCLVVEIICRACESQVIPKSRLKLLNEVRISGFLTSELASYISNIDKKNSVSVKQLLESCIKLLENMLRSFPSGLPDVMVVFACIDMYCKRNRVQYGPVNAEFTQMVEDLQQMIDQVTLDNQKSRHKAKNSIEDLKKPPNDFREMSIFPQVNDIYLSEQPFLRANKDTGGYQDLDHYLDVQFRLLREDFVAPLREGIMQYTEAQQSEKNKRHKDIRLYFGVHVTHCVCTEDAGLVHSIQFDTTKLKKINWETSKRLIYGSLLCLSNNNFQTMLFATVVDRKNKNLTNGILYVKFERDHDIVAAINPEEVFVMAESSAFFGAYKPILSGMQYITDELPFQDYIVNCKTKIQPPRYLRHRKNMYYDFKSIMTELTSDDDSTVSIPVLNFHQWPTAEQLRLDQSQMEALQTSVSKEFVVIQGPPGTGKTYIGLKIVRLLLSNIKHCLSQGKNPMLVVCHTNHALDQFLEGIICFTQDVVRVGGRSQIEKLAECNIKNFKRYYISALVRQGIFDGTNEIERLSERLINGWSALKGTYLGVLNEKKLETFISSQHMLQLTKKIPRGFRQMQHFEHRSMLLEWLGLGSVDNMLPENPINSRDETIDTNENSTDLLEDSEDDNIEIPEEAKLIASNRMIEGDYEEAIEKYEKIGPDRDSLEITIAQLNQSYKKIDEQKVWLFDANEMERRKKWLMAEMNKHNVQNTEANIWKLNMESRWKLYRYWVHRYRLAIREEIKHVQQQFRIEQERLKELKEQRDMEIMSQATVIGMTTTGAAQKWNILQQVKPKIIIVEEAAEVLESHIVTTLSPGCEHLILIGDHKQLRPSPAVYQLAKRYNLDLSLFERMVNNGMKCNTLEIQHRMRPEIAALISPIYPNLIDHESVKKYKDIHGVGGNLFFIDHKEDETLLEENTSRVNRHEAEYISALCKYFLQLGYSPDQITVLTTYSGQLYELRRLMPKSNYAGVRICVVDNYQGEENDIMLLSLVRSNKQSSIGFLSIENRVCVALSRARKGFYIIGNITLLANQSDLWSEILQILKRQKNVGDYLKLYCHKHPSKKIEARTAMDFKRAPKGGCLEPCEFRLNCGHACIKKCHMLDEEHIEYRCPKPCLKKCDKGHNCTKACSETCGNCTFMVEKNCPKCMYTHSVPCHFEFDQKDLDYDIYKCTRPCSKILCRKDHRCPDICYKKCGKCTEIVSKEDPKCHHTNSVPCFFNFRTLDKSYKYKCEHPCRSKCNAGHLCPKQCWEKCRCQVMITKNCPKCDLSHLVPCHFNFLVTDGKYETYKCTNQCIRKLCDQGHDCPKECWQVCDSKCSVMIEKEHPVCHHKFEVPCYFTFSHLPWQISYNIYSRQEDVYYNKCQVMVNKPNPICHHVYEVPCYFEFSKYFSKSSVALGSLREKDNKYNRCHEQCDEILCKNDHICPKKCYEICENCIVIVQKENPKCYHMITMPCSASFKDNPCKEQCEKTLDCGHKCNEDHTCGSPCSPCKEEVEKTLHCGHRVKTACHVIISRIICRESCEKTLECEHKCGGKHICGIPCREPCKEQVERKLSCGHPTKMKCYENTKNVRCKEQCDQILSCGHQCTDICGNHCPKCKFQLDKMLPCGHSTMMDCHADPERIICKEPCKKTLTCGHECPGNHMCGNPCTAQCNVVLDKALLCGHIAKLDCYVSPKQAKCKTECKAMLPCSHECSGNCGSCLNGKVHKPCMETCQKILLCGHQCQAPCSRICPPCQKPCQNVCSHDLCGLNCGSECTPCKLPCQWRCQHEGCNLGCSEPCVREPCNESCKKRLRCKHSCLGLCGENCPDLCRKCHKKKLKEILDSIEKCDHENTRLIQLEGCNHIFEVNYLDNWIKQNDNDQTIQTYKCPTCSTPIVKSFRYGKYIKTFQNDLNCVKQKMSSPYGNPGMMKKKLLKEVNVLQREKFAPGPMNWIYTRLNGKLLTPYALEMYQKIVDLLKCLIKLLQAIDCCQIQPISSVTKYDMISNVHVLTEWCKRDREGLGQQELDEASNEIYRLWYLFQLMLLHPRATCQNDGDILALTNITDAIKELKTLKFDVDTKEKYTKFLDEMKMTLLDSDATYYHDMPPITIPVSFGYVKDKWLKCPEGHIYFSSKSKEGLACIQCQQETDTKPGNGSQTKTQAKNKLDKESRIKQTRQQQHVQTQHNHQSNFDTKGHLQNRKTRKGPMPIQRDSHPMPTYGGARSMPTHGAAHPMPTHGGSRPMPTHVASYSMPTHWGAPPMPTHWGAHPMPTHGDAGPMPTHGAARPMPTHGASHSMPAHWGAPPVPTHRDACLMPTHASAGSMSIHGDAGPKSTHGGARPKEKWGSSLPNREPIPQSTSNQQKPNKVRRQKRRGSRR